MQPWRHTLSSPDYFMCYSKHFTLIITLQCTNLYYLDYLYHVMPKA